MAIPVQNVRIVYPPESILFGHQRANAFQLIGQQITDEKVKTVMQEAAIFFNAQLKTPKLAKKAFEAFQQFCKPLEVQLFLIS